MQTSYLNCDICLFCSNVLGGGKQILHQRLFSPTLNIALICGFTRGQPLRRIICKRPVPLNVHLKEAFPSRDRPIRMIISKISAPPDDHLHLSFVIVYHCLSLFVIVCCSSLVVVCCLSLFVVCLCMLFVVVCCLLFIVSYCLSFVLVCHLLWFVDVCHLLMFVPDHGNHWYLMVRGQ